MRALPLLLPALMVACSGTGPKTTSRVKQLLGGEPAIAAIRGAPTAAYRIDGMGRGPGAGARLHLYPVLGGPVEVDAPSRAVVASVLLDDATYEWDSAKACEFLPGVLLRYKGDVTVDVLLCFSCDELEVYVGDREVGHEDFDSRRADLVRVARRAFPDDPAIRELK